VSGEIKFRAWNSMAKKMLHFGNPIGIMDNEDRYGTFFESLEGKMYCGGNYELMQFTGLEDKNGKEIYEGDIIRYSLDTFGQKGTFICSVMFDRGQFRTERGTVNGVHLICEIIGNIYENSELLATK